MKTSRRIGALFGIAMGAFAILCAWGMWRFYWYGPFPSGYIPTEHGGVPFVWHGGMDWQAYAFVATPATLGIVLIVVSYWFDFRRHAEPVASPNDSPTKPPANAVAEERPPSVS